MIHPQVKIGNRCRIYHHVTIAAESAIGSPHFVVVGDDCVLGVSSIILARANQTLLLGSGSIIGAGAVVTRNVPDGEIWAGNPARFIGTVDERNKRIWQS